MYFKNKKTNYINMATIENKMRNDVIEPDIE